MELRHSQLQEPTRGLEADAENADNVDNAEPDLIQPNYVLIPPDYYAQPPPLPPDQPPLANYPQPPPLPPWLCRISQEERYYTGNYSSGQGRRQQFDISEK